MCIWVMPYLVFVIVFTPLKIHVLGEIKHIGSRHIGSMLLIFEETSRSFLQAREAGTVKAYPFGMRSYSLPSGL